MASPEQLECAAVMRRVHRSLRAATARLGAAEAWREHVAGEARLGEYAAAMARLARLWAPPPERSRVTWLRDQLRQYARVGRERHASRERALAERLGLQLAPSPASLALPLRVLDVGSCYNPLAGDPLLCVLPVDLQPATPDVLKCDFLQVTIGERLIVEEGTVRQLDRANYDSVIFSLLLEYLPTSEQRLQCCKTAYELLKYEGILAIISPDSKHAGANAKIYKNWRYALSFMGFSRIVYEKSKYLHCMIFRKSLDPKISERWAILNEEPYMGIRMNIPQDSRDDLEDDEGFDAICENRDPVVTARLFDELPDIEL